MREGERERQGDRENGREMRVAVTATPSVTPSYRGTSLIRNSALLGPYSRTMHRALWWVLGGGRFLMIEVPL